MVRAGGRREVGRGWGVDGLLALNGDYCYLQTQFQYQRFLFFSVEFLFLSDIQVYNGKFAIYGPVGIRHKFCLSCEKNLSVVAGDKYGR